MLNKLLLLLLFVTSCFGAIPVQIHTVTSGPVTSQTNTFSSTPTVGNVIIVGILNNNSAAGVVDKVTDNQGNPYVRVWSFPGASVATPITATLWCAPAAVSSGTFTITINTSVSDFITSFAAEYASYTCNIDKSNNGATTSTSPYPCGSITTLNANDLLVVVLDHNATSTPTFTAPTNYTQEATQTNTANQPGALADQVVTSTGTYAPTYASNQNATSNCVHAAFMKTVAASGGGGAFVVAQ